MKGNAGRAQGSTISTGQGRLAVWSPLDTLAVVRGRLRLVTSKMISLTQSCCFPGVSLKLSRGLHRTPSWRPHPSPHKLGKAPVNDPKRLAMSNTTP